MINFELDIRTDEFKKRALEGAQTSATKRNRASSSVTEISDKTIQRLHRKLGLYIGNGEVTTDARHIALCDIRNARMLFLLLP